MIKYKVSHGYRIDKVEIERETAHFVFYRHYSGDRERRESNDRFFDTFAAAKEYVVGIMSREVENAQRILEYRKERLADAEALTE